MCIQRKSKFLLKKSALKQGGNSKIPSKHLHTTVQQGYRKNMRGIGLLVMKLITAEDYQKCLEIDVSFYGN